MGIDISYLFVHSISVEPYEGSGGYGPTYGDPVTVSCLVEERSRQVRAPAVNTDGGIVVSSSTAYASLDTVAPAGSRVTLPSGRVTTVIDAYLHDGGGLPTPDHLEIVME